VPPSVLQNMTGGSMRHLALLLACLAAPAIAGSNPVTQPSALSPEWQAKTREMIKTAVEIPTVAGRGELKRMAEYLVGQFRAAGWPAEDVQVLPYKGYQDEPTHALMVRWRAPQPTRQKPILIIGHMDVVEARKADWETDPFTFIEKDGYFYGRGVNDDKQGVISSAAAVLKLKSDGFKPARDIILFYTGDEETQQNGARLGATEWKNMLDAEYALNADAGGGAFTRDFRPLGFGLQVAEKVYQSVTFTATNRGGHSSRPRPDNAIYDLAAALQKLQSHRFEPMMTEVNRAYFTARAQQEGDSSLGRAMRAWVANPNDGEAADAIEASELESGMTRTRCVATMLEGGHAENALPQKAQATVNCRIMPGVPVAKVLQELRGIAGAQIKVEPVKAAVVSPPSPLRDDVVSAYTRSIRKLYGPDIAIIPHMSTGATDGLFFRAAGIPVYGAEASWGISPDDERAHGLDERIPIRSLFNNVVHWENMLRALAGE
jgi:acetylornithine deacetylase/succinyl-diaminopimelate desuccinylase-like protein